MFAPSYLPKEDLQRLTELQELLLKETNEKKRTEYYEEIREIEGRRKLLNQLSHDECMNLKETIWDKYMKVMRIGHLAAAHQFRQYLMQIDMRLQALQIQIMKEKDAGTAPKKSAFELKLKKNLKSLKPKHSDLPVPAMEVVDGQTSEPTDGSAPVPSKPVFDPWSIDVGDDD